MDASKKSYPSTSIMTIQVLETLNVKPIIVFDPPPKNQLQNSMPTLVANAFVKSNTMQSIATKDAMKGASHISMSNKIKRLNRLPGPPGNKFHLNSSKIPSYIIKPSRLALALWSHLDISLWENPFAVTVTVQPIFQGVKDQARITVHRCEQNRGDFFSKLNGRIQSMLKGVYSMMGWPHLRARKKPHFKAIWVLEVDANGRFHYHLALDLPLLIGVAHLSAWVKELWPRTPWAYKKFHIESNIDQGWIHDIQKKVKNDFLDIGWAPNLQSAK